MTTPEKHFLLTLHLQSAELHLGDLAKCAEETERMISAEAERHRSRVEKQLAEIEDEELRQIYCDDASEEWEQLTHTFPLLLRSALFSKSFSAFETYLLRAAEAYRIRAGIQLGLADLRGDGLEKAKTFFVKVAGLPFPAISAHWSDLCKLGEIRNAMVHRDSVLAEDRRKPLDDFLRSKFPSVSVSPKGRLSLSAEACSKLIDLCGAFTKEFRLLLR